MPWILLIHSADDNILSYSHMCITHLLGCGQRGCFQGSFSDGHFKNSEEVTVMGHLTVLGGFPGDQMVKNLPANAGDMGLIPGLGRSPGEGNGNTVAPVFFPGKSCGQRSLVGYNSWGRKESDTT